jgi:hypothetical protein
MDELQAIDFDEEDRMWIVYPPESYSLSDIEILSSMLRH